VYDAFSSFFGGLTIPCLRKSTSLGNTVRTDTSKMLLQLLNSQAVTGVRGSMDWASKIDDRLVGQDFVTGRNTTESVVIHDSEFCGKTRGVGSTSTVVDTTEVIL
jgi:hypothetical protein